MSRKHIVLQGESLSEISLRYGFADWKQVYNHADNAGLRHLRPDPNVLFPGDEVAIPALQQKERPVETGATRRFTVKAPPRVLRLKLLDEQGQPLAGAPYELIMQGQSPMGGIVPGNGILELSIPLIGREGQFTVGDRTFVLKLGHRNPLRDSPDGGLSGARVRLENLGYAVPGPKDTLDAAMRVALATFQADHGLEVNGELSAETLDKLHEAHGS
ncbi:peptidoglycan-binding protein [Myxococcaceae bacterium JPH2]|nr:peptidoglycan-binding protein [Myxococcaceae bacterium JPH2]